MKNIFIALFQVLDYLDRLAIKENLLRGVGHLDPLRTPTHLRLSQKPKFVVVLFEAFPKWPKLLKMIEKQIKVSSKHIYYTPIGTLGRNRSKNACLK